jgi:hypothetical protein
MKARSAITRLIGAIFFMSLWMGGARAQNQQLVHLVQGLMQKYKDCILEAYGTPQSAKLQTRHQGEAARYAVAPQR